MTTSDDERLTQLDRAVAGLGREVEAARIAQARLADKTTVLELKDQLVTLADQLAQLSNLIPPPQPANPRPIDSWLARMPGKFTPAQILADLIHWIATVYLRYGDGAAELPECWLWHPEIIEELLWLMQDWRSAYFGTPSMRAVADWHDRYRPGVVRRITGYAGTCSLDNHRHDRAAERMVQVPTADAAPAIAAWWTDHPDQPAPEPTPAQIATADAAFNRRSRPKGART